MQLDIPAMLNNTAAAEIIGTTPETLKRSRSTGLLWGLPAPAYRKAGRRVVYHPSDLSDWTGSLPKFENTGQQSFE